MADLVAKPYDLSAYYGNVTVGAGLRSSDREVHGAQRNVASQARDLSRTNPYAKSALRTKRDSIFGGHFNLQLEPNYRVLGVSADEAREWAQQVEADWEHHAESTNFGMDRQRVQTWTDLCRTAFTSKVVYGEALASVEYDPTSMSGDGTCLLLIDPERLVDPHGMIDPEGKRRMGVERDRKTGRPLAYWIRDAHQSDSLWTPFDVNSYTRYERETSWGRPRIIHLFERDRPDMTRGISDFTTASTTIAQHNDFIESELEAAAIRALFGAVIYSELDYEDAMNVIGDGLREQIKSNGPLDLSLRMMADRLKYYAGTNMSVGKSKVAHLLPNEKLQTVQGNSGVSSIEQFDKVALYKISSALGVSYESLTKNFSDTNYSGARAALADIQRSYDVERAVFVRYFCWPAFGAWLEERILTGRTPMLGSKPYLTVRAALCRGDFTTWTKPKLDPVKENEAMIALYKIGAATLQDLCRSENKDYVEVIKQRGREKALLEAEQLSPEDINPDLIADIRKADASMKVAEKPVPTAGGGP